METASIIHKPMSRRGRVADPRIAGAKVTTLHGKLLERDGYSPDALLDALRTKLRLSSDAALARALEVAPPIISKIRNRHMEVTTSVLVRMHDVTQMPINELRRLMGVQQVVFGQPKARKQ